MEAFGRLLLETFQADGLDVAGQARHQPSRRDRLGVLDHFEGLQHARPAERGPSRHQFIEDRAQAVDVGGRIGVPGLSPRLFGGHVTGRADDGFGTGQARVLIERLGQSEVRDLGDAVRSHQDVGRLEVAVNDPLAVRLLNRSREDFDQLGGPERRPWVAVDLRVEVAALDVFELDVGTVLVVADRIDLDHVRVAQPGDRLGLGQESGHGIRVGQLAGQDHLHGDDPIETEFARLVDDPHPPSPQLAQEFVTRQIGQLPWAAAGRHTLRAITRATPPVPAEVGMHARLGLRVRRGRIR